ncbi:MAG: DEAD/DEAH box helicase [Bifidobacteriaceae bacterium]|nr:DEAD/DEAH box helicase [Bifidobacteriaceae bacterium]
MTFDRPAPALDRLEAGGFAGLGLPPHLLDVTRRLGFDEPTEIQTAAIPPLLAGRDIVGVAQTGTGKTAAFGLPLLDGIDRSLSRTQALVLAPTRELALQVAGAIEDLAQTSRGVRVAAVYGGAPYPPQKRALEAGAHIVVGTPGRVIDHLERGTFTLEDLRFLVLDEGDEMLRMGFAEEVETILSQAPEERQTALFSATMPPAIRATAERHLSNPLQVFGASGPAAAAGVDQRYAVVPFRHKVEALTRILAVSAADAAIVFVRTRADAEEIGQELIQRGINAAGISGDVTQRERERIVERLRNGALDVLVATDVAARGLDVDRIGLVVNFDLPREGESYVHRIGRTGRAGRAGIAFSFVTPAERGRLRSIERIAGGPLTEHPIPTAAQVAEHKYAALLSRVPERIAAGRLEIAHRAVTEALEGGADPVALAAALAALSVDDAAVSATSADDRELDTALAQLRSRDRGDRDQHRGAQGRGRDRARGRDSRDADRGRDGEYSRRPEGRRDAQRYWIGVGHGHGAAPGAIVGAITGETTLNGADLGRIEMFKNFSLVEIGAPISRDTMRHLAKTRVAGRALKIRPDIGPAR